MSTELATIAPQILAFKTIDEIEHFAKIIAMSPFVPKAFEGKPGSIVAAIMYGLELGLTPMSALQNIAVINGKASVYGDLLLGMCLAHPSTEYIKEASVEEIKETGVAWCEAKRKGREALRYTFSREDAELAKLTGKDIWKAYPHRMLQMRPRGFCLRDVYADVLKGIISREEAQDYIDVTPMKAEHREVASQRLNSVSPTTELSSGEIDESEARHEVMRAIKTLLQSMFPYQGDLPGAYRTFMPRNAIDALRPIFGIERWADLKSQSVEALRRGQEQLLAQDFPAVEDASDATAVLVDEDDVPLMPSLGESDEPAAQTSPEGEQGESSATGETHQEPSSAADEPPAEESPERIALRTEAEGWGIPAAEVQHILSHHAMATARTLLWKARQQRLQTTTSEV